ncbi:hypothetical protein LEP1GSC194_1039 [Leptospira alstonii serovar Sichuan str. 79601]|uniref:Uncharacterized protein n=1 Tax=Leptospira alstonii serovar Sichuan str. 79601 TaxID=1218565 RepID=M6CFG0_9LEPT|nr:hypothetical protein LEP1GSC194_1039 [Leptospira alstonii serovar Sichuan str. 79601]
MIFKKIFDFPPFFIQRNFSLKAYKPTTLLLIRSRVLRKFSLKICGSNVRAC